MPLFTMYCMGDSMTWHDKDLVDAAAAWLSSGGMRDELAFLLDVDAGAMERRTSHCYRRAWIAPEFFEHKSLPNF